jgi:hypothetical protein
MAMNGHVATRLVRREVVGFFHLKERLPVKENNIVYEREDMALQFPASCHIGRASICRNE